MWETVRRVGRAGRVAVRRDGLDAAARKREAKQLVELYAADEPEVLRRDFYNSLLAAYREEEVARQLRSARLDQLSIEGDQRPAPDRVGPATVTLAVAFSAVAAADAASASSSVVARAALRAYECRLRIARELGGGDHHFVALHLDARLGRQEKHAELPPAR
jgi:hypothetical protein